MLEQLVRVDAGSFVPVTTQLGEQIKYLIVQGMLRPGEQLPSVRDLAASLGINRNTVAKVVENLEQSGHLRAHRGKGVYVADQPPGPRDGRVTEFLDETLRRAKAVGLEPASLAVALLARARDGLDSGPTASEQRPRSAPRLFAEARPRRLDTRERMRVLLLECNQPQLEQFRQDLEEALDVEAEALLLDDLKRLVARPYEARRLAGFDAAVTTFPHLQEAASLLKAHSVPVVPVLAEIHPKTLWQLAALPPGTVVGVACVSWAGAGGLRAGIENAGLRHLQIIQGCTAVPQSLKSVFERARVVVCSSLATPELDDYRRGHGFAEVELWLEDRRLDPRGLAELGRELALPVRT